MTTDHALPSCPLCASTSAEPLPMSAELRVYLRCPVCALVYLHPDHHPDPRDARARYELHCNRPDDPGYVRFLRTLADPLIERLQPGALGLDYGSGPAPVLAGLFTAAGFPCMAYDPFFAPGEERLREHYDFVACSEVAEHVYDAASLFERFARLLARGGVLGVMTRFPPADSDFERWWYRRDPTHVCFYSASTMRHAAARMGWDVTFPRPNVALFTVGST